MTKFIIEGLLPSLNEYIDACRKNRKCGAKFKDTDELFVSVFINNQIPNTKFENSVHIKYKWYEKNKKRDKDNISSYGRKIIQDALVNTGVLVNDTWKYISNFSDEFYIDKDNPRIEVEIYED